jgi:hypothetical protein
MLRDSQDANEVLVSLEIALPERSSAETWPVPWSQETPGKSRRGQRPPTRASRRSSTAHGRWPERDAAGSSRSSLQGSSKADAARS